MLENLRHSKRSGDLTLLEEEGEDRESGMRVACRRQEKIEHDGSLGSLCPQGRQTHRALALVRCYAVWVSDLQSYKILKPRGGKLRHLW